MMVNEKAPVVASGEIEVAAQAELVWEVMTAIERWPSWNPDVKWATLADEPAEGKTFRWKSGPGVITSTIQRVDPPRVLAWTGTTMGIKAIHVWQLEARNGKTLVRTAESWEGLIVRLFRGSMQRTLESAIHTGLGYLKTEVERRATS